MPHQIIKPEQVFDGEQPENFTHPKGREITVLLKPGQDIYVAPGRAANFGGAGGSISPHVNYWFHPLQNGNSLQLFFDEGTGLFCCDIAGEKEGREIVHFHLPKSYYRD